MTARQVDAGNLCACQTVETFVQAEYPGLRCRRDRDTEKTLNAVRQLPCPFVQKRRESKELGTFMNAPLTPVARILSKMAIKMLSRTVRPGITLPGWNVRNKSHRVRPLW